MGPQGGDSSVGMCLTSRLLIHLRLYPAMAAEGAFARQVDAIFYQSNDKGELALELVWHWQGSLYFVEDS